MCFPYPSKSQVTIRLGHISRSCSSISSMTTSKRSILPEKTKPQPRRQGVGGMGRLTHLFSCGGGGGAAVSGSRGEEAECHGWYHMIGQVLCFNGLSTGVPTRDGSTWALIWRHTSLMSTHMATTHTLHIHTHAYQQCGQLESPPIAQIAGRGRIQARTPCCRRVLCE